MGCELGLTDNGTSVTHVLILSGRGGLSVNGAVGADVAFEDEL